MGDNFRVISVNLMCFLRNLFLYSGAWFRQTKCIVMMTKKGTTKTVNFFPPGQGFLCSAWPYKSYSENTFFLKSSTLLPDLDQTI